MNGPLFVQALLVLICTALALGLVVLGRSHARLRRQFRERFGDIGRHSDDLAGLCAAAVQLDRRVLEQEQRLKELQERFETLSLQEADRQIYYPAIDRAKRGARPEELVAEFGLSVSEANLLARLYHLDPG